MKTKHQIRNLFLSINFVFFCFAVSGQVDQEIVENKGYIGLGIGSILHLDNENSIYNVGLNSVLEGSYFISPYVGFSAQLGFNKLQVSSLDDTYKLLEDVKLLPNYDYIENSGIEGRPGMNMGYLVAGPIFTVPVGKLNIDLSPKAGLSFTSPFYQYDYFLNAYYVYGFADSFSEYHQNKVSLEGENTTTFLLDIELALRTQLADSGFGFKFFTKFIHNSFTSKMERTHSLEVRTDPEGEVKFQGEISENIDQKVKVNALSLGLSLIYNFK